MISVCIGSVRGNTIGYFINSMREQTWQDWELIVVTQGTDAQLFSELEKYSALDKRVHSFQVSQLGKTRALNSAVRQASGDLIAFTDDDCTVAPNWLETLANCFDAKPEVGLVAGDTLPAPATSWQISTCPATHTMEYVYYPSRQHFQAPFGFYWGGGNLALRRTTFEQLHGFDEYFGPGTDLPAAEDMDFALRAEASDIVMWTTPRARVYHTYGRRTGLQNLLRLQRAYAIGSGGLLGKLHLWNHPLAQTWSTRARTQNAIVTLPRHPLQSLRELYTTNDYARAYQYYLDHYELDELKLSHLKTNGRGAS